MVDAGSGLTAWTRRFWLRAQCVVLVTTADDASVMDAYAAMKASSADGIRPVVRLLVNREINGAAAEDAQRRVQNACRKFLSLSIDALPALPLHEGDFVAGATIAGRVFGKNRIRRLLVRRFGSGVRWVMCWLGMLERIWRPSVARRCGVGRPAHSVHDSSCAESGRDVHAGNGPNCDLLIK